MSFVSTLQFLTSFLIGLSQLEPEPERTLCYQRNALVNQIRIRGVSYCFLLNCGIHADALEIAFTR